MSFLIFGMLAILVFHVWVLTLLLGHGLPLLAVLWALNCLYQWCGIMGEIVKGAEA
jgi:hypothetical protein